MKNLNRCLPLLIGCQLCLGTAIAQESKPPQGDHYERIFAAFERLPIRNLESAYLHCARESEQRMLSVDEAAFCSIGSEVLKKRRFGGDFDAMLAWWKVHRNDKSDNNGNAGLASDK